jgi:hypothetical protein
MDAGRNEGPNMLKERLKPAEGVNRPGEAESAFEGITKGWGVAVVRDNCGE